MILITPLLAILLWAAATQQSGFTSPNFVTPYGSGSFENVVVWYVGQVKEVIYDITDVTGLDNYTIALWQQNQNGGAATLGPVVNSTSLPDVRDSFSWTVQLYDFDLDTSNVFFFWIFEGDADNQGNTAFKDVSSAYFNISSEDPPVSSTTSSTTAYTSTTTSKTSSTLTSTSTSTPGMTIATTAGAQGDMQETTASASTQTTAANHSEPSSSGSTGQSSGLSTGAGIGIGVGVGLAGLCAVACAIIIVRDRRRRLGQGSNRIASIDAHELPSYGPMAGGKPSYSLAGTHSPDMYEVSGIPRGQALNYGRPAELNANGGSAIELDAGAR